MSRGGRGRGGFGVGRGGFGGGGSTMPPMGLTYADIATMPREPTDLYPPMDPLPILSAITDEERKTYKLQLGFADRLRTSPYYIVESKKSTDLPRYSDKYKLTTASQPTLQKKNLNPEFFPPELWDAFFNPKKKKKEPKAKPKVKINLDEIEDDANDAEKSDAGTQGSQQEEPDYDEEEQYGDDDYGNNYFDDGEGDDMDDGGGGDDGGAEATYD